MHLKHNIKLKVAYDGTAFLGWQETKEGPSIEGCLKAVLEQILQEKVTLQAASRTDRGVHAEGQIVNFFTEKLPSELKKKLNCLLPPSIRILEDTCMPSNFHPTLDVVGKEYTYTLCLSEIQPPCERFFSYHLKPPLNRAAMKQAAALLVGKHDLKAFCNFRKNLRYTDTIRDIFSIEFAEQPNKLLIKIAANHFLYKMARNIIGTLIYVGQNKLKPEEILSILASKKRACAAITAPAHALTLSRIYYPGDL